MNEEHEPLHDGKRSLGNPDSIRVRDHEYLLLWGKGDNSAPELTPALTDTLIARLSWTGPKEEASRRLKLVFGVIRRHLRKRVRMELAAQTIAARHFPRVVDAYASALAFKASCLELDYAERQLLGRLMRIDKKGARGQVVSIAGKPLKNQAAALLLEVMLSRLGPIASKRDIEANHKLQQRNIDRQTADTLIQLWEADFGEKTTRGTKTGSLVAMVSVVMENIDFRWQAKIDILDPHTSDRTYLNYAEIVLTREMSDLNAALIRAAKARHHVAANPIEATAQTKRRLSIP